MITRHTVHCTLLDDVSRNFCLARRNFVMLHIPREYHGTCILYHYSLYHPLPGRPVPGTTTSTYQAIRPHFVHTLTFPSLQLSTQKTDLAVLSNSIAELDDKLGSWWNFLPMPQNMRFGKVTNSKWRYHQCLQANLFPGYGNFFSFVPPFLTTGNNFGCTCFCISLCRLIKTEKLHQPTNQPTKPTTHQPQTHQPHQPTNPPKNPGDWCKVDPHLDVRRTSFRSAG